MRTIIAGSRSITDYALLELAIANSGWADQITVVLSGTANGVDQLGERWAKAHNIPIERYPANWDLLGKKAGIVRNIEMANHAEACLVLWTGTSKGSAHMLETARKMGLKTYSAIVEQKVK